MKLFFKCNCEKPPFHYLDFNRSDIGEDSSGAEISVDTCKKCGAIWLVYLIEEPHYSNSGRWWRTKLITPEITPELSKDYIESQDWCFVGGSFHNSTGIKKNAPIKIT